MWKFRPPWPSFTRGVLILLIVALQICSITPRGLTEDVAVGKSSSSESSVTAVPSIIAAARDHNHHHHHKHDSHNKDKRRKRKKTQHQQHTINNFNDSVLHNSINSHNNRTKVPKNDDFVELIDEIDELDFVNGTKTNIRRKKDGYYVQQPNGVVVYRRYKCVPKTKPQSLTRPSTSYTSSQSSSSSYGNQRWRQWGM